MKEKLGRLLEKPWAAYTFAACSAVALYLVFSHFTSVKEAAEKLRSFFSPILIGAVTAYIFNPAEDFFEKRLLARMKKPEARHTVAVLFTIVAIVLLLALFLVVLIPSVVNSVSLLMENRETYLLKADELLFRAEAFTAKHDITLDLAAVRDFIESTSDKLVDYVKNNSSAILSAAGNVGSSISDFVVGVLFGFCFLFSENVLVGLINRIRAAFLSPETLADHNELLSRCNGIFLRYLGCTLLDCLIIGVCTLVFMLVTGMSYAPLIAFICAFTNVIPTLGPWIGTGIGVFFLVLDTPANALWFVVFCCVLQSIDGMLIKPRLFKNGLGIPAAWSFILLILGGKLAGMAGILLSIPVGAVIEILYKESLLPWLEKRAQTKKASCEAEEEE